MRATETLSSTTFIDRVESRYPIYFDGTHVLAHLHIDHLRYYGRLKGVEVAEEVLHAVVDLVAIDSTEGMVARHDATGLVFITDDAKIESLAQAVNGILPTYGRPDGLEAKIGYVALEPPMGVEDAMRRAGFACLRLQGKPGDSLCRFEGEVRLAYEKHNYVVDHLDDAIAAGEIEAWSQPIVRVLSGNVCEVETLVRWRSERYGMLFPDEFIGVLEDHLLIHKLDLEVIRRACAQWAEARALGTNVPFGVNLSRLDFELCDIFGEICALMERYEIPVDQLHIEVTESLASADHIMEDVVRRFQETGFKVYMDDFGSGYSSLGRMADMTFDTIKFDKSMLDHVEDNERARAVLADTVSMVKRLGMHTLCEGVETQEQLEFLRAIGCEKAQGYFFGKPSPHEYTMETLDVQARRHEEAAYNSYLDAIGQINLMDGTSAKLSGVEASTFLGRFPIAVLQVFEDQITLVTSNFAFLNLVEHIGHTSFDALAATHTKTADRIVARFIARARIARETRRAQVVDFIAHGIFCSATIEYVAETQGHEAYLTTVTSVENAPTVTEHTLLMGVLETSTLCYFWKDTKRRFLGCNQRFLDYFGFESLSEIYGRTDEEMGWHPDGGEPYTNDEKYVLEGHAVVDSRGALLYRGEVREIISTKRPLYSHGAVVGLVGFFQDLGPDEEYPARNAER